MHVEDLSTRKHLYRIVRYLTPDITLRDDLMQEALVHLWLSEIRDPGQKKSYYLQSCKFHLKHYLESGRSVDSAKRRNGQIPLPDDEEEETLLQLNGIQAVVAGGRDREQEPVVALQGLGSFRRAVGFTG